MKKIGTWLLNNLKWLFAVVAFVVTAIVISSSIIGSYNSYKDYEKAYEENDLALRSNAPAAPKSIAINDEYKSSYKNQHVAKAEDLTIDSTQETTIVDDYIDLTDQGGKISLALTLENKSFVDIDFKVSSTKETTVDEDTVYGVKDLLNNVTFTVNGETMDDEIDLPNESGQVEFHHLIMSGFALPAGDVIVTIESKSGKNAFMPQLGSIALYSSQTLALAAE